jgi:hypothetical protein
MIIFLLLLMALMAIWLREIVRDGQFRHQRYKISLYRQAEAMSRARVVEDRVACKNSKGAECVLQYYPIEL